MEPAQLAKMARESLTAALNAIQSCDDAPDELFDQAESIAQTITILRKIERSGGAMLDGRDIALKNVRKVLSDVQAIDSGHPATDDVLEAVASSLAKVNSLARYKVGGQASIPPPAEPAAPRPVATPAPSVQPDPVALQTPTVPRPAAVVHPPAPAPLPVVQAKPAPAPAPQPQPAPVPQPVVQAKPAPVPQPVVQAKPAPAPQPIVQPQAVVHFQPTPAPAPAPQPVVQAKPAPAPAPVPAPTPAPAAPAPEKAAPKRIPAPAAPPGVRTIEVSLGTRSVSNFYKGLSGNDVIEHGGMFVETYRIPQIGTQVQLHVIMPGDYEFYALGNVAWTRDPGGSSEPGFGARFTQIGPDGRQLVYRYTRNREPMFHDDL